MLYNQHVARTMDYVKSDLCLGGPPFEIRRVNGIIPSTRTLLSFHDHAKKVPSKQQECLPLVSKFHRNSSLEQPVNERTNEPINL